MLNMLTKNNAKLNLGTVLEINDYLAYLQIFSTVWINIWERLAHISYELT